ncbi:DNA-protecting protein DprA [Brevibacillus sp. SYP-B805]|uniref:DNA-processing protein DprA n=1 Tax=Brevibacillus sp. SYP-B805 TaxID=1578199 RepID=UPI0013EA2546|nr:DNA-processing protein DprA [Brevibacillus sp. SYP-B805]NGQ93995.1 DNA-protecting protein DprA [Brevibacillus sp. SYP-B805]
MTERAGLEERDWLYALATTPGVGRKRLRNILETWGSLADFAGHIQQKRDDSLLFDTQLRRLLRERLTPERVWEEKRKRVAAGIRFVCLLDADFPAALTHIPDPPLLLFYKGELGWLDRPLIAVVGTRRPTPYGKAACARLCEQLAKAGFVIVSGVASGIDAEAHRAALRSGAGTVGVLGCGIDQVYPPVNRPLYRQVESSGLLLSEYPPGTPPRQGLFPERNRIISGLSLGVVVIEAAEKSGSLITADCALEQGKEVFAVPGPIFSEVSAGPHNLIKQGAKLVTGWEDILDEFPHLVPALRRSIQPAAAPRLEEAERKLLALIPYEPVHWDHLHEALDPEARRTMDRELVCLETKGCIISLPGGYYARRE